MNTFTGKMAPSKATPANPWTPNYEQVPGAQDAQAKQPYADYGTDRLGDTEKYYTSKVLAEEWQSLLSKSWQICGNLTDVPQEHNFMKVDFGKESFLIIRGEGNSIRGFYNVCQHRGTRIVREDFGHARKFTCPFHGWAFTNDGKIAHVPGAETFRHEVLCRNLDLEPVSVATWKGWIFFNMDKNAQPLEDYLGERMRTALDAYDYENFVRVYDIRQTWPANWKLSLEAFIEGYHVTNVHPELCTYMDDYYVQHDMFDNGHGRSIFPFMEPAQSYLQSVEGRIGEINDEMKKFLMAAGVQEGEYPTDWKEVKKAVIAGKRKNQDALGFDYAKFTDDQLVDDWHISFFPCASFNTHPEGLLLQRWWPDYDDPKKTYYTLQIYAMRGDCIVPSYMPVHPDADRTGQRVLNPTYLEGMGGPELGPVVAQDVDFIPWYQAGVASEGFRGTNFGEQEIKNQQFWHEYYRYMNHKRRQ